MKKPGRRGDRAGGEPSAAPVTYLLPLVERFSPCWLLRLLLAPPRLALALPSCERLPCDLLLLLPDALPRVEVDDFEVRVAMNISLSGVLRLAPCA